ncbi:MAG: hypothetical protein COT17_08035 [Elusimicrobia bacterium CG08_land_8_20_14_0_20_51_18]|nr:MAG: hypothetical protein COT17_08035 [Elusimicrobia bacterium CG08_land_8_20_14_0_20_51_18]
MEILLLFLYFPFFALIYAGLLIWILERGEKKYRVIKSYDDVTLLAGSMAFIFVYLANIMVFFTRLFNFFVFQAFLLGLLGFFIYMKEKEYRDAAEELRDKILDEIERFEEALAGDPGNTAYHQHLAKLYDKVGETEKALVHAEKSVELEPTVRNEWRKEDIKKRLK